MNTHSPILQCIMVITITWPRSSLHKPKLLLARIYHSKLAESLPSGSDQLLHAPVTGQESISSSISQFRNSDLPNELDPATPVGTGNEYMEYLRHLCSQCREQCAITTSIGIPIEEFENQIIQ
jgi:hypothetical protein